VWLLDAGAKSWRSIKLGPYLRAADEDNSIAFDKDGNIYASSVKAGLVVKLSRTGNLLGSFGRPGYLRGEFRNPVGVWLNSAGDVYVADSQNGRVQVFRPAAE
jgi:DNA-binding beta-propeller fold protein YncE